MWRNAEVGTVVSKGQDVPCMHYAPLHRVREVADLPERCFYENHTQKILKLWKACRENSTLHVCQQVSQFWDTNILVNFDLGTWRLHWRILFKYALKKRFVFLQKNAYTTKLFHMNFLLSWRNFFKRTVCQYTTSQNHSLEHIHAKNRRKEHSCLQLNTSDVVKELLSCFKCLLVFKLISL